MSFSWLLTVTRNSPAVAEALAELGAQQTFESVGEADAWLSEVWEDLAEEGVEAITLTEDGEPVRPPMSLAEA